MRSSRFREASSTKFEGLDILGLPVVMTTPWGSDPDAI